MIETPSFFSALLDTIDSHIAVIDRQGEICFVNARWSCFAADNELLMPDGWIGINYLNVCKHAAEMGDEFGASAAEGIQQVVDGVEDAFYIEYPCHSPDTQRWYMMRVFPLKHDSVTYYVVSHQDITERKLAEERVLDLSRTDGLTGIPNRRYFDSFFEEEWRRCQRLQLPVALALIDVDHFKEYNDLNGHLCGDYCLRQITEVLSDFARRPGDLHARFGGEEFVLLFGNMTLEQAEQRVEMFREEVQNLNIPHDKSPTAAVVTVSAGVSSCVPSRELPQWSLIQFADQLLYRAKSDGRNRIVSKPFHTESTSYRQSIGLS